MLLKNFIKPDEKIDICKVKAVRRFVFETFHRFFWFLLVNFLGFACQITVELKQKVSKALELVGLEDVADKKSGEFSGGMKRRLNLACGIAHSPKLIIMDEPTVGIDPQSRNRILENVKALNEAGATILYTTHYMPEVEEI